MYVWTEALSVGVKEMDDQHRRLFDLANEVFLFMAKIPDQRDKDPLPLLSAIMDYTLYHVHQEEQYMHDFSCTDIVHVGMHRVYEHRMRSLFDKACAAVRNSHPEADKACIELARFTGDWHLQHIQKIDRRYMACFNEHGLDKS